MLLINGRIYVIKRFNFKSFSVERICGRNWIRKKDDWIIYLISLVLLVIIYWIWICVIVCKRYVIKSLFLVLFEVGLFLFFLL